MAVTVLNKDNFKNEVLKADKPVLVDFLVRSLPYDGSRSGKDCGRTSGDKSLQGGH